MDKLKEYIDEISSFLEEIFYYLKLNINYSFDFIKVSEEDFSISFYNEAELSKNNEVFFNFVERYNKLNPNETRIDSYIFALKKFYTKSREKIYLFKVGEFTEGKGIFFILRVDLDAYNRHIDRIFNCNYLDFLFGQLFYKITHDFIFEKNETIISTLGAKEIISLATKSFINSLDIKGKRNNVDVFETINSISKMRYENKEAFGEIIISRYHNLMSYEILKIESEVGIREIRKIRKLLEGTKGNFSITTDLENIYGFINKNSVKSMKKVFKVKVLGSEHWELYYEDKKLLKVVDGVPTFDKLLLEKGDFNKKVGSIFKELLIWEREKLWNLVEGLIEAGQGSLLVISEGFKEEAARLSIHSTVFKPFEMRNDLVVDLSKIDGAILISPKRVCSAIGVILDGVITERGDSSRGARYNSALKYYETLKDSYRMIVVVVSEDGVVDILG